MMSPLNAGIARICNQAAATRCADARRLTQRTVIENNRLLFTGIASELPRFEEDKAARILFQSKVVVKP